MMALGPAVAAADHSWRYCTIQAAQEQAKKVLGF
jgi:hypothetical protein